MHLKYIKINVYKNILILIVANYCIYAKKMKEKL
jgi:hypothetical protein